MTQDQLIASAEALLDLDARGALVPHGIGGHARTIIEGFLALSRRVPASGGEAERADELWESLLPYMQVASHASGAHNAYDDKVRALDLIRAALSPIVAAPEGWRTVPVEPTGTMIRAGVDERDRPGSGAAVSKIYAAMLAAIPEGKAEPVDAELRLVEIVHVDPGNPERTPYAWGLIYGDSKGRFPDGDRVRTSKIIGIDGDVIRTRNTVYRIGSFASPSVKP